MNANIVIAGKRKGISNWIRKFSTEILPGEGKYRSKESVLGIFRWSKEHALPKIDYVLVFRQVFAKCEACSIEDFENNIHAYFQVSLVHGKNRRLVVHESRDKNDALDMGNSLARALHVQLKDSSARKK